MAARPYPAGLPIIELEGVSLNLGGTEVLRCIDLSVRCGERLAIIGPSGSGKSTLLRCMNGLARPSTGVVRLFGEPIDGGASTKEARLRMETIFQSFNLYSNRTVLQNVMLVPTRLLGLPRDAAQRLAMEHLDAMGIADLAARYPFQLSGGQQQRVALARALAKSPEVLLLDEPTSALDPERVQSVLSLIAEVTHKGVTTVMVTHELGFARRQAHRMIFMCDGRIVEDGTPEQMLERPRSVRLNAFLEQRLPPAAPVAPPAGAASATRQAASQLPR